MNAEDFKFNLDLMNALIKLREADLLFDKQYKIISEHSDLNLYDNWDLFFKGYLDCTNAIKNMFVESLENGIYDLIPGQK